MYKVLKPRNQIRWTQKQLELAAKMFMSGDDYPEIALAVGFSELSVLKKLTMQGFTKEYREKQTGRSS